MAVYACSIWQLPEGLSLIQTSWCWLVKLPSLCLLKLHALPRTSSSFGGLDFQGLSHHMSGRFDLVCDQSDQRPANGRPPASFQSCFSTLTTSCRLWFFVFQQKRALFIKMVLYIQGPSTFLESPTSFWSCQAKLQVKVRSIIFLQNCLPPNTIRFVFLNKCSCSCASQKCMKKSDWSYL